MPVVIEPVQTRGQLAEFIALPRLLYREMPGYVPPLDLEQRNLVDTRRAPFFSHGVASYWIARRKGRAVGRISAQIDQFAPPEVGHFGCFDAIDEDETVAALLAVAEDWLRARKRVQCSGPFLLSINGQAGLLVEGQNAEPMTLMPWHPDYLDRRLRESGYRRTKSLYSYRVDLSAPEPDRLAASLAGRAGGDAFKLRGLRVGALDTEGEIARRLFNDAWRGNWGFTPVAQAEMRALVRGLRPFMFPDSALFLERNGEPVAFAWALPNLFEISRGLEGSTGPLGLLNLLGRALRHRNRYRSFRVTLLGIAERYRSSALGGVIAARLMLELIRRARARGVQWAESGWVLAENDRLIRLLDVLGHRRVRVYGIYEKRIVRRDPP